MAALVPDSTIRVPLLRQAWRYVTFLHWRFDAAVIQSHLPHGVTAQEYDGTAWLSLTPLQLTDIRAPGLPPLPGGLSTFPEINLRTYVRGPDGSEGIWFFSLDADSAWITVAARSLLGVPYVRSELAIDTSDGVGFIGARHDGTATFDIHVRPGQALEPDDLDIWLTHRWRAFSRHAGALFEIPLTHEPWPLRTATAQRLEQTATAAAGLPNPDGPALVHYSDGVEQVAFGVPRRHR